MEQALGAVFPATTLQTCIVHLIRNSLDYASWKDRKALATALRPIYAAPSHRLGKRGSLGIGRKSLKRAKDRLREATRRNRGISLGRMIEEVNRFKVGWVNYYRDAGCRTVLKEIDQWLRRRLRCVRLKHCKNPKTIATFLREQGVREKPARQLASSGKGWWRLASTEQAQRAMPNAWFDELGLIGLEQRHTALNRVGNRRGT